VWDFCRAVDDSVDEAAAGADRRAGLSPEAHAQAAAELAGWRSELAACYEGTPRSRQGQALQPFIRMFNLPRAEFDALIDGVEMDLGASRYQTFDALLEYCRRVAGTVGLICLEIFEYRDPGSRAYALHLATGLQLTNIIRDVGADLAQGRVYLPAEDLRAHGVDEATLAAGRVTPAVRALLAFECGRARDYFRQAETALPRGDRRRLVAAAIMGGIYFGILERIEQSGYDVFNQRVRVPRPQRLHIALTIWARTCLGLSSGVGH
jgi:phytoene synthase